MTDQSDLNISDAAFGPSSSEATNRPLGRIPQSCPCVNDDMIEAPIAIEVDRERMGVAVVIAQGAPVFVSASQFWAMDSLTVARTPNNRTVQ